MMIWLLIFVGVIYFMAKDTNKEPITKVAQIKSENLQKIPRTEEKNDDIKNKLTKLIDSGKNIFITGGAGTGKSYILNQLKKIYNKKLHLTSTTGISAINIKGQTIHSWSGIGIANKPINVAVESIKANIPLYKQIVMAEMLAIDEISMLRSDIMDYIDATLRLVRENNNPFGGLQLILIGDFFQLPPIPNKDDKLDAKDFCFNSKVWKELNLEIILLRDVKRQTELEYIEALNNIRKGKTTTNDLRVFWGREEDNTELAYSDKNKLHLFSTNREADQHNELCLAQINQKTYSFLADDREDWCDMNDNILRSEKLGEDFYQTNIGKKFNDDCRVPKILELKVGCQVMLLKNLNVKAELANGSIGHIVELRDDYIGVLFKNGISMAISKEEFEVSRLQSNKIKIESNNKNKIKTIMASKKKIIRKQYPLRLAYGITIHKSQGMTFDEVVVHCEKVFADGQAYVALSRTKTLQGLYLRDFSPSKVIVNNEVVKFYDFIESENLPQNTKQNTKFLDIQTIKKTVEEAISEKKELKIKYQSNKEFHTGAITDRYIKPIKIRHGAELNFEAEVNITYAPDALYLVAFCNLRKENRIFMLDRIMSIEISKE